MEERQSEGVSEIAAARRNSNASTGRKLPNVDNYNAEEGKIRASIKWLVSRIFADGYVPDGLRELFFINAEGYLQVSAPLIACLTNGSFYCQAASRIFRDNAIVSGQQNIGTVFAALSQDGIDVRDPEGNSITEQALLQSDPFNISVHLHMIDALMIAHLRSLVSIEKVVQAISNYTAVEKREEPLDCVDALLFWINKICLLVRDDVERNGLSDAAEPPTIPEMEDLYEDLSDGTCICALLSFYRPNEVLLQEICFNDPMSVNDSRFNLEILRKFCSSCLPWNPFHFEIDDVLLMDESLQPNINAFLADLFQFFEGASLAPPEPVPAPVEQHRRFVPVQPIPDLRAQTTFSSTKIGGTFGGRLGGMNKRDRASSMASEDSLATLKTKDSLTVSTPRPNNLDPNAPNVTHFAAFRSGYIPEEQPQSQQPTTSSSTHANKGMAEIRLQMEEMRRQLGQQQQMKQAMNEQRRNEAGKDAFFKVMSKSGNNELIRATPEPPSLTRSQESEAMVAQFQQMTTNFGSQLSMAPTADQQTQQHRTPQQQQFRPASGFPQLPQQQLHNSMQTSTPQANLSGGSVHPMLSPIGPPQQMLNSNSAGSFDPSSLGATQLFNNRQFMSPNQQQSQSQYFTPQQQFPVEQPHYAVPNGIQPPSQHPQFAPAPPPHGPYGFGQQQPSNFGMMAGGPYGPSSSQPSHLHMVHQQPQQQQFPFQQQQYPSQQFQQQTPYYHQGQHAGYASGHQMGLHPPAPQQYFPSPLPPPMNSATMFPSADQLGHCLPATHLPTRLFMDNTQQQQMEDPSVAGSSSLGTFRLHQTNAPQSRLDPQLDLNRGDLTNWGQMTYRAGDRPQRKTWAQKQSEQQQQNVPGQGQEQSPGNINNLSSSSGGGGGAMARLSGGSGASSALLLSSPEGDQRDLLNRTFVAKGDGLGLDLSTTGPIETPNNNRNGGIALADVSDPNSEMTPEMQAKRQAILANQMKRKERILAKSEEKEVEEQDRLQVKMQRIEQAEQRKLEREQRRQKLLEDYKRKKLEQELGEPISPRMAASSTISLNNRGHSQPPFGRPKSQSNMNLVGAAAGASGLGGTLNRRLGRAQSSVNDENVTPRVAVPALAEPAMKLYAKHQPKSNRGLIMNALQYSVFPGHVSNDQRTKAQAAIAQSDSKHFLVLFRDHKCQYRGLYTWDQFSDTAHKIEGLGPKVCKEVMMTIMYKYDSGAKSFSQIPTKHLSATIDGFVIADQYWQKPKIPHSGR